MRRVSPDGQHLSRDGGGMLWRRVALALAALPLAAFFAFVGWYKAFASMASLAAYHAWTVWLPLPLGRAVGWSELACAILLLGVVNRHLIPFVRASALVLIVNQLVAAVVHAVHDEVAALPQNIVLIAMLAVVAWLAQSFGGRSRGSADR
ncbi:MAG TPA: DoxX family protein [Novosphingobium sp.]|nr:DoxX family protein [Novosphingobium sp.]